mmetsp:Transcript_44323/g.117567  ORF Transcript_44323/g.117567 Transcript_44323/m.117567 type:complete len:80 (-) Transcript_44323:1539-1778(-)
MSPNTFGRNTAKNGATRQICADWAVVSETLLLKLLKSRGWEEPPHHQLRQRAKIEKQNTTGMDSGSASIWTNKRARLAL